MCEKLLPGSDTRNHLLSTFRKTSNQVRPLILNLEMPTNADDLSSYYTRLRIEKKKAFQRKEESEKARPTPEFSHDPIIPHAVAQPQEKHKKVEHLHLDKSLPRK